MVDEVKRSDLARDERMREQAAEKARPKQQQSEFDKLVKSGGLQQQATAERIQQNRPVTEQAIDESAKREQREQELKKKERDERKEKKESREEQSRDGGKITDQKVVGKGGSKQGGGGGAGGEGRGGYQGSGAKRGLSKKLTKAGIKTLPADLTKKFAARLVKVQAQQSAASARLTQQALDRLVQYVRMGINRAGEKEIQIDLHERIFRGLKLRVIARGGKVGVHLRTSDARGREALQKSRDELMKALSDKGIEVSEISIS